jgi:hypothetical protein
MNRLRSLGWAVEVLIASLFLAGCGETAPPEVATPTNPQAGLDALKKLQDGPMPTAKGMQPSSGVPKK